MVTQCTGGYFKPALAVVKYPDRSQPVQQPHQFMALYRQPVIPYCGYHQHSDGTQPRDLLKQAPEDPPERHQ